MQPERMQLSSDPLMYAGPRCVACTEGAQFIAGNKSSHVVSAEEMDAILNPQAVELPQQSPHLVCVWCCYGSASAKGELDAQLHAQTRHTCRPRWTCWDTVSLRFANVSMTNDSLSMLCIARSLAKTRVRFKTTHFTKELLHWCRP